MEVSESLGKVRPERVKKIAKELVERFPDKFTTNFEDNKKLVESFAKIPSTKLRNRIAGYITRLLTIEQVSEAPKSVEPQEAE